LCNHVLGGGRDGAPSASPSLDIEAKPFIWRANPNDIVAARNRGFQMLDLIL